MKFNNLAVYYESFLVVNHRALCFYWLLEWCTSKYLTVNRQAPLPHTHIPLTFSQLALMQGSALLRVLSNSSMSCLQRWSVRVCDLALAGASVFWCVPLLMGNSPQDYSSRGNVHRLGKRAVWSCDAADSQGSGKCMSGGRLEVKAETAFSHGRVRPFEVPSEQREVVNPPRTFEITRERKLEATCRVSNRPATN